MFKGYDVKRGDFSEAFKQYLRDRGLYFEPSSDGSWVHFEVKNADEAVDRFLKQYEIRTRYVYEFPEGTTLKDINLAKRLGLKYLGQAKYKSGARAYFIEGTLAELKNFAYEAFGDYELVNDYLCKADEFAGVDELTEAGYFEDKKYEGKDKRVRIEGSKKIKDSDDSRIIQEAQKQIDIQENIIYSCYDEETGDWRKPYSVYEAKENKANEKAVELCNLIVAYGGTPKWSAGLGGIPVGYEGPIESGEPKDYPTNLINNAKVIRMCQQEMDRLVDDVIAPLYYDEEADEEIDDWYTPEGQKISLDACKKLTALANVITAYGGTPYLDDGFLGAYEGIKGETKLKYSKDNYDNYLKVVGRKR